MSIIKSTNINMIFLELGILASSLVLLILLIGTTDFQVLAATKAKHTTNLANMDNNLTDSDSMQMNLNNSISNKTGSIPANKLISIVPLNENQRPIQIDSKLLKSLESNKTLGNLSSILSKDPSGTCDSYYGIDDQTPCAVALSNNNQSISSPFDFQVIYNDNTNSITQNTNYYEQPDSVILQPGELFVFSRTGGEDYENLDIYLVDSNTENGNIIGIDSSKAAASVLLDHFKTSGTDFFMVPTIDDGFSSWKLIIEYETNDELESYFIVNNVTLGKQ